jgi:hypothetical protein
MFPRQAQVRAGSCLVSCWVECEPCGRKTRGKESAEMWKRGNKEGTQQTEVSRVFCRQRRKERNGDVYVSCGWRPGLQEAQIKYSMSPQKAATEIPLGVFVCIYFFTICFEMPSAFQIVQSKTRGWLTNDELLSIGQEMS